MSEKKIIRDSQPYQIISFECSLRNSLKTSANHKNISREERKSDNILTSQWFLSTQISYFAENVCEDDHKVYTRPLNDWFLIKLLLILIIIDFSKIYFKTNVETFEK